MRSNATLLATLIALVLPSTVAAQDAATMAAPPPEEPASQPPPAEVADESLEEEQVLTEERVGVEQARESTDPYEDPEQGYFFLGAFYRHLFVPSFLQNLFLEESPSVSNPSGGIELTYRKDNFDIVGSLWWASYAAHGPYRASGDPETDVEIIKSELSAIFLSGTFLWSTPFSDVVALEYGLGIGVGLVLGDLERTEAYPDDGPGNFDGFSACQGPGNPDATITGDPLYCDATSVRDGERGGHYRVIARKWTDGGDVPNVVPWLAIPHIALRIKPIHQLMFRIEGGFGLGFFLGGSASYGF